MYARQTSGQTTVGLPRIGFINGAAVSRYDLLPDNILKREGWLPYTDERPEPAVGEHVIFDGYQVTKSGIAATYRTEPEPEPEPETVTIPAGDYEALIAAVDVDRLDPEQAARIGVGTGKTARKQ